MTATIGCLKRIHLNLGDNGYDPYFSISNKMYIGTVILYLHIINESLMILINNKIILLEK